MTSINAAITDLRTAVEQLTKPITRRIHRDGGPDGTGYFETRTAPSLLDQLREARVNGTETGKTGRSRGSGAPLDLSAHLLLDTITTGIAYRLHTLGIRQRPSPESGIAALVAQIGSQGDPTTIVDTTTTMRKWAADARRLLAGTAAPRYLRGLTCTICATTSVVTVQDGERTITPAIRLITREDGLVDGAQCQHCGTEWNWNTLDQLATTRTAPAQGGTMASLG